MISMEENSLSNDSLNDSHLSCYENLPVGILTFDENFIVNYINPFLKKFGILSKSIAGTFENQPVSDIFTGISLASELRLLQSGKFIEKEVLNQKRIYGGEISIILKGAPVFFNDVFMGGVLIIEDIQIVNDLKKGDKIFDKHFFESIITNKFSLFAVIDSEEYVKYITGTDLQSFKAVSRRTNETIKIKDYLKESISLHLEANIRKLKENRNPISSVIDIMIFGSDKHFEVYLEPKFNSKQDLAFIFIFLKDVTEAIERNNTEKKIINELQFYQLINEANSDALVGITFDGKIDYWNKGAETLFGYKKSEIHGFDFGKLVTSFDVEYLAALIGNLKKSKSFSIRLPFFNKSKNKRVGEYSFFIIKFEKGELILINCKDITEFDNKEKHLISSEEQFRNIVQNTTELICSFDINGQLLYANPAFINAMGFSEAELKRKNLIDLIAPTILKENGFNLNSIVKSHSTTLELDLINNLKQVINVAASFSVSSKKDTATIVINGIFSDITEKKASERELLMMRKVFEASQDGMAIEQEGIFILANDSFAKLFGYLSGIQVVGLFSNSIIDSEERQKIENIANLRKLNLDASTHYEFLAVRRNGTKFYCEVSVTTFEFNENHYNIIIARDVTERKRTQFAIKESEERYRNIAENIEDFFYTVELTNNKLRFVFFTSSVEKITGYQQIELLSDSKSFFRITYPNDFTQIKKKLKDFLGNYYKSTDEFEYRIIKKDGSLVWIKNKLKAIRDEKGEIQKIYGLVSDISLYKKAEEDIKKTTENLKKLNDTKDRFISIISHDLRTPFSSVLGFTDLLLNDDELTKDERRQYVKYIQESSHNMLSLVNSLLDWTRLQTGRIKFKPIKTDLSKIVDKAVNSVAGFAMQKEISILNKISNEIFAFIDGDLIFQAVNNLFSNALKFTNAGGSVTINVAQSKESRFFEVTVSDTGVGIPQENISKIFEVDSKITTEGTKGEKGTGLGLSLVREIVEKHGGKIWVESEKGKGAAFKFLLPKASATILFIDDSNTDRILYSKIIKSILPEYEVITAESGNRGLELVMELSPALIISDHTMPEMTGYEFVTKLFASKLQGIPPLIILSDKLVRGEILGFQELGVEYIFQKPVNLSVFKDAIEKSLKNLTLQSK